METLRGSANSVLGILNDILDLSKVEAGRMSIAVAPFDLESELAQIVDMFLPQARAKSTALCLTYPAEVPHRFVGDGHRVRQVVSNFVSNAVKFTDEGEIHIELQLKGGCVRIYVRDTGIGISSGTLPLLFSKFMQADPSAPHRGTGLGLAICKQLAELMGGNVGATSIEGKGSIFWVDLPLNPEEPEFQPQARQTGSREPRLAGLRVLLAEDNVFSRSVLSKLLASHGMVVDVVTNGKDAVSRLGQTEYAMILMDCQMPEMDGCEATRRIRAMENSHGIRTPVIAITALALASERDRCREAGMDDFLIKPFAPEQLLECIAAHLAHNPKPPE
jgi:CheY-like chemotaxis protein